MSGYPEARWGFHRLDRHWARRLVAAAAVSRGDLVLDVGAGTGALTGPLLAAGATVVAVELHPGRAEVLSRRFAGRAVRVVRADATDLRLPRVPFRVVANPPFAVVEPLLRRLVSPGSRLVRADLVVPRHVARAWSGGSGPGSVRWSARFEASVTDTVPRSSFRPPARRDAAVLVLAVRPPGRTRP